jgi:hypothetical protein
MLQQSLIGEWMYRYGLVIIIIGCLVLIIAICAYAIIKKKASDIGYKKRLEEKLAEKQKEENNM